MQIRQPEKLLIFLSINEYIANVSLYAFSKPLCLNVSTTPITAMGCRQCLRLRVVQLKGKHCRKPHRRNGAVDMFGHGYGFLSIAMATPPLNERSF